MTSRLKRDDKLSRRIGENVSDCIANYMKVSIEYELSTTEKCLLVITYLMVSETIV